MPQFPIAPSVANANSVRAITAATVVKPNAGTVYTILVSIAGTAAGAVYDANTTGGDVAANLVASIPDATGVVQINWPCKSGILVVPGAGQTVSIAFA